MMPEPVPEFLLRPKGPPNMPPDAASLGRRMAALYRVWAGGMDLPRLATSLLEPLRLGPDPLASTCHALAAAVTRWGGPPYHSALHHAEVATNAAVLAELAAWSGHPLPARRRALLLAACLGHDYLYRPGGPRFAAEAASADAADAVARRCGLGRADRDDLRRLILLTEPGCRRGPSGNAQAPSLPRQDLVPPTPASPDLASLAAPLSDADLLSGSGLTWQWSRVQQGRLGRELGRTLTPVENLAFLEGIVGPSFLSPGGHAFDPNLRRITAACRAEAEV